MFLGGFSQYNWDRDAARLFERMDVQPSFFQKLNINEVIVSLKREEIWNKLGFLHVFATHSKQAALLDWKGDVHNCIAINSPVFTENVGFVANGVGSLNVSGDLSEFDVTGAFTFGSGTVGQAGIMSGTNQANTVIWSHSAPYRSGGFLFRAISTTTTSTLVSTTGFASTERISASNVRVSDGMSTSIISQSEISDAALKTSSKFYYLKIGESGVPTVSPNTIFACAVTSGLTELQTTKLYEIMQNYMYGVNNVALDVDTIALISRMTVQPDPFHVSRIDKLIKTLKSANIWDKLHFLHVFGSHDEQAATLDWKDSADLSLINSPTFLPNIGFVHDSGTTLKATKIATQLGFEIGNMSVGSYHIVPIATNTAVLSNQSASAGLGSINVIPNAATGSDVCRIYLGQNTGSSGTANITNSVSEGMFSGSSNTTRNRIYKNGVPLATQTPPLNTGSAFNTTPLQYFYSFSGTKYGSIVSMGFGGSDLTDNDHIVLTNAVETYLYDLFWTQLEHETKQLINRMHVKPIAARAYTINKLIKELKTNGTWDKLQFLNIFAAHDEQAATLDWRNNGYDVAIYNSPAFTTDRGFKGNSTSAYLSPINKTWLETFPTMNGASMGTWEWTNIAEHRNSLGTDNAYLRLYPRGGSGDLTSTMGSIWTTGNILFTPIDTSIGLTAQMRVNNTVKHIKNGSVINTFENVSVSPTTSNVPLVYLRVDGNLFGSRSLSMGFAARGFTDADHLNFYNAIKAYMEAVRNLK